MPVNSKLPFNSKKKGLSQDTGKNKVRKVIKDFKKSFKIFNLISNPQFYNAWQTFSLRRK